MGLALLLGFLPGMPRASAASATWLYAICAVALAALAAPLLGHGSGPERWLGIGPFNLYVAPLLLPSLLGACAALRQRGRRGADAGMVVLMLAGLVLALQPDASQVLALLAGTLVLWALGALGGWRAAVASAGLALAAFCALRRPDTLEPVPYVEGVFTLARGHSLFAGAAVLAGALVLVAGLGGWGLRHARWVTAVAAYYGVLFACSAAGLTPAPLIGYGAGPLLGFGLMVALAGGAPERLETAGS
jgi:cell division protein FtsW (lipid II flippase)